MKLPKQGARDFRWFNYEEGFQRMNQLVERFARAADEEEASERARKQLDAMEAAGFIKPTPPPPPPAADGDAPGAPRAPKVGCVWPALDVECA